MPHSGRLPALPLALALTATLAAPLAHAADRPRPPAPRFPPSSVS